MSVENDEPIILYISGFQLVGAHHLNAYKNIGEKWCLEGGGIPWFPPHTRHFSPLFHPAILFCCTLTNRLDLGQATFLLHSVGGVGSLPKTRLIIEPTQLTECLEEANNIRRSKNITGHHIAFWHTGPNELRLPLKLLSVGRHFCSIVIKCTFTNL